MTKEKDVKLKICSKCKIEKNINEFHTRKDNKEEQKKCFHHNNLQPLWADDNLKKTDKYFGER